MTRPEDGRKDAPVWAGLDWRYRGPNDSKYAEGFFWGCCNRTGDHKGCRSTKHKAGINTVVTKPSPALVEGKKRKAAEDLQQPLYAKCVNCRARFNVHQNEKEDCVFHPGIVPHELAVLVPPETNGEQVKSKSMTPQSSGLTMMRTATERWQLHLG
jgi:hypothetical protein